MSTSAQNILKQHIHKDEPVILGLSGGPDSVYLLLQALHYTKNVIVAHVNHKTRGRANSIDQKFAEGLAKNHNLTFELHTVTTRQGNREENFRNERYRFFEKLRKKYQASWILVAHHLNDNLETVLFNLAKGSFLDGLSGMEVVDHKRHILHPLLLTSKDHILDYLKKTRTPYRVDKTNNDIAFSRNRIRHNVIPELKQINASLEQTFAGNIQNIQDLKEYFDALTHDWIDREYKRGTMNLQTFQAAHPVLQKNVLYKIYGSIFGEGKKMNQQHLRQMLKIIEQGAANRKKEFGESHYLSIEKKDEQKVIAIKKKRRT